MQATHWDYTLNFTVKTTKNWPWIEKMPDLHGGTHLLGATDGEVANKK